MLKTYKILSALLSYPTVDMKAAAPSFMEILIGEDIVPSKARQSLAVLIDNIARGDLLDMQERYVFLFDRTRSLSLHLFEHVHGESRDRGQAMVDLQNLYRAHGLVLETTELPDFLPLFLEFLAMLDRDEAREMLCEPLAVLTALAERLKKRQSVYASAFMALLAIANEHANEKIVAELLAQQEDDPSDLVALDRAWEEEAVNFGLGAALGPDAGGCGKVAGMVDRLNAARPQTESKERI